MSLKSKRKMVNTLQQSYLMCNWNLSPRDAIELQKKLSRKVKITKYQGKLELVAGCDVSFSRDLGCAAVVVMKLPEFEIVEKEIFIDFVEYPYIPGLLAFREGPLLLQAINKLKIKPDIFIFDGQGIAHPRGLGIASHMGVLLDIPTIGCAKSILIGKYQNLGNKKGDFSPLIYRGKIVGYALRTRENVKPVFVSPGNLCNFEDAREIVLKCCKKYRLPEPLRQAHIESNAHIQEGV